MSRLGHLMNLGPALLKKAAVQVVIKDFLTQNLARNAQAAREDQQRNMVMQNRQNMQSEAHDDVMLPVKKNTNFYKK